jgi:hypothetical protein
LSGLVFCDHNPIDGVFQRDVEPVVPFTDYSLVAYQTTTKRGFGPAIPALVLATGKSDSALLL